MNSNLHIEKPEKLLSLAIEKFNLGEYSNAGTLCHTLLKNTPTYAPAYDLLGFVTENLGDRKTANTCFLKAVELEPNNPDYLIHAARHLMFTQSNKAEDFLKHAIDLDKNVPDAFHYLARIYGNKGNLALALTYISQAIKITPNNPEYFELYTYLLERTHALDELEQAFISLPAEIADHEYTLLPKARLLKRKGQHKEAIDVFTQILNTSKDRWRRAEASMELAKLREKEEDYTNAFMLFSQGKHLLEELYRSRNNSNNIFLQTIDKSLEIFTRTQVNNWQKPSTSPNTDPIFLVGFPRSGTTLLEQILSAHPRLTGTQESPFLVNTINHMSINYLEGLDQLTTVEMDRLIHHYIAQLQHYTDDNIRAIDKLPFNIIYLPFIYRLFPNAKILVLIRDPRDVCFSCFANSFNDNPAMAEFVTLEKTITLYVKTMDLYAHYRSILPCECLEIRYEDMVDDIEHNTKNILDFIEEPWDNQLLNYYDTQHNRLASTPSYEAVMKPIYNNAIGRWQHYKEHFAPFINTLEPYITTYGYDT